MLVQAALVARCLVGMNQSLAGHAVNQRYGALVGFLCGIGIACFNGRDDLDVALADEE